MVLSLDGQPVGTIYIYIYIYIYINCFNPTTNINQYRSAFYEQNQINFALW
jgi:hypothetical protein